MTRAPFTIVCVSPQDWETALPTNRQQIMARAAQRGHQVLFVETSYFLGRHLWRLVRRRGRRSLLRRLVATDPVEERIAVMKAANLLPWGQKWSLPNRVNCALTAYFVRRRVRALPAPVVLWIYDPCGAALVGACGETRAVYDCVDDYGEQTGDDARRRALVEAGDELAARRAALVFATTESLLERQSARNPCTHLVRNGADFAHFARALDPGLAAPETTELARPIVGFVGNMLPLKVDFELLEELACARPSWTLLLVGPATAESLPSLRRLERLANVTWLGARPYDEVPRYVAAFDVGLIPYRTNAYTRSCSPLKLYEYLAAGKPVVATGLPELAAGEPDVALVDGAAAVVAAVERALAGDGPEARARRMAIAATRTWDARVERLLMLVEQELAAS